MTLTANKIEIENALHAHRQYFATHQTKDVSFRRIQLMRLNPDYAIEIFRDKSNG